jgi:hypothetical protein
MRLGYDRLRPYNRHLIPRAAVELATAALRTPAAPLLEEVGNSFVLAAITQLTQPFDFDRPVAGSALAARDEPINAAEIEPF